MRHGSPLSPFLAEFFIELLEEGLIEVGDPSLRDALSPVMLTDAGQARYSELCRKQRCKDGPGVGAR